MDFFRQAYDFARPGIPTVIALIVVIIVMYVARFVMERRAKNVDNRFGIQVVTLILWLLGLLAIVILLPISDASRGQLLSLLGILLSAAIALSSTTLLGNLMAGMMLRAIRNFKPGDFVTVGNYFGRVSERGLFHVEIQTEDRDLMTLPNIYLVTNPVQVSRTSGTIISATVSLGYDLSHTKVEERLLDAANLAELQEPFVQIVELGDFAVTYRVAGLLTEVKQIISARSKLREYMLDCLHEGGVEIVSPAFMNTRALDRSSVFVPPTVRDGRKDEPKPAYTPSPEDIVFDKAEKAQSLEELRERYAKLGQDIDDLKKRLDAAPSDAERDAIREHKTKLENTRKWLEETIEKREEESRDEAD
jgi:small conductance mechanosensitive channel